MRVQFLLEVDVEHRGAGCRKWRGCRSELPAEVGEEHAHEAERALLIEDGQTDKGATGGIDRREEELLG